MNEIWAVLEYSDSTLHETPLALHWQVLICVVRQLLRAVSVQKVKSIHALSSRLQSLKLVIYMSRASGKSGRTQCSLTTIARWVEEHARAVDSTMCVMVAALQQSGSCIRS